MDMEYSTGQMELIMRDNGSSTKLKERARFGMLRVMFIGVISRMIWPTVRVSTLISMAASTKESSKMMCKKDTAKKNG